MEKKTECDIVQDLLLGYVDNTLNIESKKLVEKHLSTCENCRSRLEEIREDIKENQDNQKKEIDYLKKIRRKSKIKSILIAFAIIILIVLVFYINKFIKINSIMQNANKSLKSQNYYVETQQILYDGDVSVRNVYFKDGKYKQISKIYSNDKVIQENAIYGQVGTDERIEIDETNKSVVISNGDVTKMLNDEESIKLARFGEYERNSLIANMGKAFLMSINTDTYDIGREYYVLRNQAEQAQRWEIWVDKETGLVLREINRDGSKTFIPGTNITKEVNDVTITYDYSFNTVTDEDVQVPDYSSYKVENISDNFSDYES